LSAVSQDDVESNYSVRNTMMQSNPTAKYSSGEAAAVVEDTSQKLLQHRETPQFIK